MSDYRGTTVEVESNVQETGSDKHEVTLLFYNVLEDTAPKKRVVVLPSDLAAPLTAGKVFQGGVYGPGAEDPPEETDRVWF